MILVLQENDGWVMGWGIQYDKLRTSEWVYQVFYWARQFP